eukprot:3662078-Prymnesium_polylepis.1
MGRGLCECGPRSASGGPEFPHRHRGLSSDPGPSASRETRPDDARRGTRTADRTRAASQPVGALDF